VACSECHAVPTSTSHATGTVAIAWGPLATSGGLTPSWNGSTCSSTYCHGSFKGGNAAYAPDWTRPSGAECGTCHGLPPPAPHPQNAACAGCHPSPILGATHVNGTIDLVGFTCTSCHGDGARLATPLNPRLPAAPPLGTRGETLATERAVGAHQRHLVEGPITRGVACSECHQVPTSLSHPTGTVELVWGRVATTAGDAPRWDGTALTCANTWCHGAFRNGNTSYAPIWTEPAATVCGTCHGVPPGGTHPQNASCGSCHTGYTATTVDKDLHVNGTVDVAGLTCSSCHGDPTRAATAVNPQLPAAPPLGTRGETSASERAVGAHQRHLAAGPLTAGVRCDECHQVPTSTMHATGTVELTWGAVARTGSVTPAWDGATCSNTYCHGNFRNGNAGYAPAWTAPAADACGTCHGVPPGGTHPQNPSCGGCHAGYTSTTVDPARHVNGTVDVAGLTCSSCHGDATRVATALNPQLPAAPPIGTRGETSASDRAVGAHQRHLNASAAGNGVACGECHQVPTSTTHATGSVEIAWGPLTTTGGASPTWNGTSCRNTYCHGNFRNGNATYAPAWTSQAADACGTCHGLPPGGTHPVSLSCGGCHDGYTRSSVDARTHMNGRVDLLPMACTSCHGDASRAGVAGADPNVAIAPPQTATLRSAGAHLPHANDGSLTSPIGCATCHAGTFDFSRPLGAGDLGSHPSGTLVVAFAGRAAGPGADTASVAWTRGGAPPTYDATSLTCAATYCHGSYAGTFAYDVYDYGSDSYITKTASFAGAQAAPAWTDGPATCGSCHGNPPPTGAWHAGHAYPQCQVCHPDATGTAGGGTGISDPTLHVNGAVDVAPQWGSSCFGCH
jgi:predicted CxxxxCH...CXXCH cytochrome family protein